jgi:hypothetical protein
MVYLAGDNNLTEEMVWSLQEMEKVSSRVDFQENVNLVAQFDATGASPHRYDFNNRYSSKYIKNLKQMRATRRTTDSYGDLASFQKGKIISNKQLTTMSVESIIRESFENVTLPSKEEDRKQLFRELSSLLRNTSKWTAEGILSELESKLNKKKTAFLELEAAKALKKNLEKNLKIYAESLIHDRSSSATLESFVIDQIEHLPTAQKFMVVLSGHGSGALGDFLPDEDPRSALSIPRLGKILKLARKAYAYKEEQEGNKKIDWQSVDWKTRKGTKRIDILGMDSCVMSMAEVCWEVRDSVEFMVGAEGYMQNTGWPYRRALEPLIDCRDPLLAAKRIVENHVRFYGDYEVGGLSADLAVCNLRKLRGLIRSFEKLVGALNSKLRELNKYDELTELSKARPSSKSQAGRSLRDAILLAHWYCQSYKYEQYVDLFDFCLQLKRFCKDPSLQEISRFCGETMKEIENVVEESCYVGPRFQHSYGLSVYFPWAQSDYSDEYKNLKFAKSTNWHEFLETFLEKTRRVRRHQENDTYRDDVKEKLVRRNLDDSQLTSYDGLYKTGIRHSLKTGIRHSLKLISECSEVIKVKNSPDGYYPDVCPEKKQGNVSRPEPKS